MLFGQLGVPQASPKGVILIIDDSQRDPEHIEVVLKLTGFCWQLRIH